MKFKKFLILPMAALIALPMMFMGGCRHHGFGEDHSDKILKHVDKRVGRLDLSPEQEKKYQEIRARMSRDLKASFQLKKQALQSLKTEFQKPEPDVRAAAENLKTQIEERTKNMSIMPTYFAEVYEILNENQKKEVLEKIRSKLDRF